MLTILLILSQTMFSGETCCSQHGDICGDKCCDGTPFPKHCGTFQIIRLPPITLRNPSSQLPLEKTGPKASAEQSSNPSLSAKKWLYTWENSDTGALCLSSMPPPWYRNTQYPHSEKYPRVLVYDEYHRLVDDTEGQQNLTTTPPKTESPVESSNSNSERGH